MKMMGINFFTLSFEPGMEKLFKARYFKDSLTQFRVSFFLVMLLYALFIILDKRVASEFYEQFFVIRFHFVVPFLLGVLLFSFTPWFERVWQPLLMASFIVSGVGIAIMTILKPDNYIYYAGMMLIFSAGYFFIKLRFFYATIAGWSTLITFNLLSVIKFNGINETLITINFFYISANVIGMMAAYYIEFYSRRDFHQQTQLEAERTKISKINKSLGQKVNERTKEISQKNKELIIAKDRAVASDKMKSKFLANVSHELRTPLNAITGYAQLILMEENLQDELIENAEVILLNGEKLERMVGLITEISDIQAGGVKIKYEKVNLNEVILSVVERFADSPLIDGKELEIKTSFDLSDDILIETVERKRIQQIFENLYENALKFTRYGEVIIGYTKKDHSIECFVKDTGSGIPENIREFIFNRSMEFAGLETHNDKGAGLGLRFCWLIVNLYKGEIWFDTRPDHGTDFYFTIPCAQ
jgi:signal transduction histidine kinase